MPERYSGMGYWEMITRQMSIVSKSQQNKFKESKIAVIGCGGIGGSAIEMLARMGIGELIIVDKDQFDLSNLNRQVMSSLNCLSKDKVKVTKERIRSINPYLKITSFNEELTEDNVETIIGDSDIVIDALDNLITRIIISRYSEKKNIPFIHGAIHKTLGELTVFNRETKTNYEEMFNLPSLNKPLNNETKDKLNSLTKNVPPVIGPVPNIIGSLEAMEAYKIITKIGKVVLAPKLLTFDLLNYESFNIEEL